MQYTYFVPRNRTKLITRGGTSLDCGDDSHPGEEIYTPSWDKGKSEWLGTERGTGAVQINEGLLYSEWTCTGCHIPKMK